MTERRPVTIVNIISPSYTGTTWLSLLLGSHPRAFALGAPDRVWSMRHEGFDDACRVHGESCEFWPSFFKTFDGSRSLYHQLADAADRDVIVINNPSDEHEKAELHGRDVIIKPIQLVRDGRALACSYARHQMADYYDSVVNTVRGVYRDFPFQRDRSDVLALRYEDTLNDQDEALARIGMYLGLEYDETAVRFWEHAHHITAGNAGAIALLKLFQGIEIGKSPKLDFYRAQYEQMKENGRMFEDNRWEEELGPRERFIFDHFCGKLNAAWGYDEDAFTTSQRTRFSRELRTELRPREVELVRDLQRRVQQALSRLAIAISSLPRRQRRLGLVVLLLWMLSLLVTGVLTWIWTAH